MPKNKTNNNKNLVLIIAIIVIVLIGLGLLLYNMFFKSKEKFIVPHETVDKLFEKIETTSCSYVNEDNMGEDTILYLVFTKLKKDDKLADHISVKDYRDAAKTILGKDEALPDSFSNYDFDGYIYTLSDNTIKRTKGVCSDKQYISKLYGYSYNETELTVNVKISYIKDKKIYNLEDKELGDYDEKTLNDTLDYGTGKVYTYYKSENDYYLKEIANETLE